MQYYTKAILFFIVFLFGINNSFAQQEEFKPVRGMTIGPNYIAFEAEATKSPLGKWEIVKPGDSRYLDKKLVPPIGETHLEFTGNNPSVGEPNSPLEYKFICPKTGTYRLGARLYQRLMGQPEDKCNDVYVRMAGDFTTANNIPTYELKQNLKFFGRGVDKWGALYSLESHNFGQHPAIYNLKEGELYTLTVSGRAQRTNIDYWLLFETSLPITLKAHQDLAAVNDEKYRPIISYCNTFNAVDMKFTGIEGYTDASIDNKAGMEILQIQDRLKWAAAQMVFIGTDGNAIFTLNTLQEKDGESTYRLRINGDLVGEVSNNRIFGTEIEDYSIQSHLMNETEFHLQNGDTIQIEFNNTTNGLVPEGNETATARGRWLNLEICTTGSFAEYAIGINPPSVSLMLKDSILLTVKKELPLGADTTVLWSSSNSKIASVDNNGNVLALDVGSTIITASVMKGKYPATCEVSVIQSLPFGGKPFTIPGLIEAEDFDIGGEGKAYHDVDANNIGKSYRTEEGVDIEANNWGGYTVFSFVEGEWLMYSVNVAKTGSYFIHMNVASVNSSNKFYIEVDGEKATGDITFNGTDKEQNFEILEIEDVNLSKGLHALKLVCEAGDFSINWISIYEMGTIIPVSRIALTPRSFYLEAGEIQELIVNISPVNATKQFMKWSSSDENIAQVNEAGLVKGINEGAAFIKATTNNGALADSVRAIVYGTNSVETTKSTLRIYPNPFQNSLTIESVSGSLISEVNLLNPLGQCIYKKAFTDFQNGKMKIEFNNIQLSKGIYFIELKGEQLYEVLKIQKK